MPDYPAKSSKVAEFMGVLLRSGIEPQQVSYEAYKYALAILEMYGALENSTAMEVAASTVEEAAKLAGIHSDQLQVIYRHSSRMR